MHILQKAGLDICVVNFFTNYLIDRKTNYFWNDFSSPIFDVNIEVGQGSALSPILSALYLSSFLYILENHLKNLNIPMSIIFFIDDGLFIFQNKLFDIYNSFFFYSYNVMTKLLDKFGLIIEHSKTEVFHFNRSHSPFIPPPLDLSSIEGFVLTPKNLWKYLGFIFDRKLSFYQHIDFYSMSYASPLSGNYIPTVISSPNYTIPPSTAATFLATHLIAVLQPSGYSIFHGRDTPIQLGFL